VVAEYGKEHAVEGKPREVLRSLTTFIGGGAPRFWNTASPEQAQLNYAQVLIEVADTHDTNHLIEPLQRALDAEIPGARVDMRQLETGAAFGIPVQIRISGEDIPTLRAFAARVSEIFRSIPAAARMRDNWGPPSFTVHLKTDSDRANISGVSNLDVAGASSTAMNGANLTVLRDGDDQIPIVARMRAEERAALSDIRNLYVYSSSGQQKVPFHRGDARGGQTPRGGAARRGHVRLRPVLITVAATSSRSFPSPRTAGRCGSRCAPRRLAG
jgi:multidrug efflux pump subunit AcrB